MTNTSLLNQYIERSGLKLTYIAQAIGLSRSGFYKKINNQAAFNQYEIEALCSVLGIKSLREKEAVFFAKNVD